MGVKASLKSEPYNGCRRRLPDTDTACHEQVRIEVTMKIRELAHHWEENAKGRLTDTGYSIHLDVEAAARLATETDASPTAAK